MTRQQFDELTAKGVVILDGATGSNLRKAGMPVGISSEQWVLENPSVLQELQRAYVDAGSQIVYAPTFAANPISLRNFSLQDRVAELNTKLVKICKDGIGNRALVAGESRIEERIFEKRFQIVEELRKMGGRITVTGRQAVVCGGRKLTGTTVCARELRGGAALVVAGLSAQGESVVKHAEYIERGYERPDQLFGQLGAVIRIREQVEE